MDQAKATSRPEGPPHNHAATPNQATEHQPPGVKVKPCTDYVHDLQKRLLDKGRQLTTSRKECQETKRALSQTRAKLTRHLDQVAGCQKRIQGLADRIETIRVNTQSTLMKLTEDVDKQLTEAYAEISTIISQFPSPPGTPEPPNVEEEGTQPQHKPGPTERSAPQSKATPEDSTPRGNTTPEKLTPEEESALEEALEQHSPEERPRIEINYKQEPSKTDIHQEPVMPTNKAWQDLLRSPAEPTTINPDLIKRRAKMVDARLIQQAPETITRIRRKKASKTAPIPHVISILKKTHITTPPPPTTEVRENGQAGSSDESSSTQHLVEDTESEASDWTEFMPTLKEVEAPPNSTSSEATDPTNDVIVKDGETQKTYVKL